MEILSQGEKIKRARVYKGLTLKDVCGDKLSVSKLSCIENDKICPEQELLKYISEKLDLDLNYLKQDIKYQLKNNINELKNDKLDDFTHENGLNYNLNYAKKYNYYEEAFELMHLLFKYYMKNCKYEQIHSINTDYYELYNKVTCKNKYIIYYMDIAQYCYINKEIDQATNFYKKLRQKLSDNCENLEKLAFVMYNEMLCYIIKEDYDEAFELSKQLNGNIKYIKEQCIKARIYRILAIISLKKDIDKFKDYEVKSDELYDEDKQSKAESMYYYALVMFNIGMVDNAKKYANKALEYFPKNNRERLANFMILISEMFLKNGIIDLAKEVSDKALDCCIEINDTRCIEKAYYYKALIGVKQNDYFKAEMYLNLSLDFLMKVATNNEINERYLEMGNIYHKMQNDKEAIKYFDLAIRTKQVI